MTECLTASFSKRFAKFTLEAHFSLAEGITALVGPSGSGKTTILRCLAGLERPDAGKISFRGESWDKHLPVQQRRVGFVFNDYALFPNLTVRENIRYGLTDSRCVEKWLEMMGLEELGNRRPHQLSAGQQQRVALARALAPKPRLLLMDEPFSSLDPHLKERIYEEFLALLRRKSVPTVLVTHDLREASRLADRILVLSEGKILQAGPPREILLFPNCPEVARFVGIRNLFTSTASPEGLIWENRVLRIPAERSGSVDWFVQPDRIELSAEAFEGNNFFSASILEMTLAGPGYRLLTRLEGGGVLEVFAPMALAEQLPTAVFLRLPPESIQFFEGAPVGLLESRP